MLSLSTQHWKRYKDVVYLLAKYGWADVASQIGLLEDLPQEARPSEIPGESKGDQLARDLESLGPTFVKIGQLLLAISDGRGEDAADIAVKMGMPKADFAKNEFSRAVSHLVAETRDEGIQRLQTGRIVLSIQQVAAHNGFRLPDEVTMLGKTLMHLDQVLGVLAPEFQLNTAIRRYARTIMRRRSRRFLSLPSLLQSTLEIGEFAQKLPLRLNRIMDHWAENEVRLQVDALDEKRLLKGIQKRLPTELPQDWSWPH